ncbi:PP-loop family-domain-containing protein [Boeremia exigua]|uniref:PP-loop family-domain-containing protein n=1 Tax=Boeremia exigua TaxID=749465 RepID=UPI001E8CB347|nr:PP-loop family-domain-containing protein [Boeremia exigua]KAH6615059.1 PP-loop family-domain-containing protein [Boeremia exigua]
MWRSNVSRVRNCPSTAVWRNTRRYSSQSKSVTIEEFENALKGISSTEGVARWRVGKGVTPTMGLAISGGVDSMALASLFARSAALSESKYPRRAHAFIVDHKVRSESAEEAEWVAEQCRTKFGMQASVLPLTWPATFDPLDHKRFETDARTLRYQALGLACRQAGIRELLVAHHADDQAETVLMRLANNRLRSGLQAMQPVEWIPECYGIHGVSHSGVVREFNHHAASQFESGGVRVLRPLLGFDKSRLIATCEQNDVAWAEDKTNHIQTYTTRNAVRHILKSYHMPAALSIKSLVKLSNDMQERVSSHKAQAHRLLERSPKRLNIQVGSLYIQFPRLRELLDTPTINKPVEKWTHSEWNNARNTATCLLVQAGQLVSPREVTPPGEIASTLADIWPEFGETEENDSPQGRLAGIKTSHCVHGIWWRKCDSPSICTSPTSQQSEWLLTRQPLESHRSNGTSASIRYPPSHEIPLTQDPLDFSASKGERGFQLFDGRWWISVQNFSIDTLVLRHFTKADLDHMAPLKNAKRGGPEQITAIALSLLKPADIRFTLPALFQHDTATKVETLIGFPTLDVSMGKLGSPEGICSWRVRYKTLDSDIRAGLAIDCKSDREFDPGVTHAVIEDHLARSNKVSKKKLGPGKGKPRRNSDNAISPQPRQSRKTQPLNLRDQSGRADQSTSKQISSFSERETARRQRAVPLIPTAESERCGRSEKKKGGGYNIKWEDFNNRFS